MRCTYISLEESFNSENPLARLFPGGQTKSGVRRPTVVRRGAGIGVAALLLAVLLLGELTFTEWTLKIVLGLALGINVAAPFMGQWIRKRIDGRRLVRETITTTLLTERDKLAVVHGRILQWLSVPGILAALFLLALQFIVLREWTIGTPRNAPFPWATLFMTALGLANWVAGCYLRATILATTRLRFWPASLGAGLALLVSVGALITHLHSSFGILGMDVESYTGKHLWFFPIEFWSFRLNFDLSFVQCMVEFTWCIVRLAAAAFCWRMAIKGARRMAELERLHGTAPKRKLPFFC